MTATADPTAASLARLGWTEHLAHAVAGRPLPADGLLGRVTRVDRTAVTLMTPNGQLRAQVDAHPVSPSDSSSGALVTGDWIVLAQDAAGQWRVTDVVPRSSLLTRASVSPGSSRRQGLAANVDVALVVEPLWPEPSPERIERLITLAWDGGVTPTVVLTKADLVTDVEADVAAVSAAVPGVEVVAVGLHDSAGLDRVRTLAAPGRTLVLLGRSGAGKSTLLNALAGEPAAATADVRRDGKGRHTTVSRELRVLPGGGLVIDTPGLRSVGLTGEQGLDRTFQDIADLARGCRFRDCRHDGEPGCAVRAAVQRGELSLRRLESWRRLDREAAWMARRHDARLAAEESARVRRIHRDLRRGQRRSRRDTGR